MRDMVRFVFTLCLLGLSFTVGLFIGTHQRGKSTFFVSWTGKDLYYGERVRVKDHLNFANFYNRSCKKMTLIGLQEDQAWVRLEDCTWATMRSETFNQDDLEAK